MRLKLLAIPVFLALSSQSGYVAPISGGNSDPYTSSVIGVNNAIAISLSDKGDKGDKGEASKGDKGGGKDGPKGGGGSHSPDRPGPRA